jgi:rhomboid family GlyGly-CTERM serine protease
VQRHPPLAFTAGPCPSFAPYLLAGGNMFSMLKQIPVKQIPVTIAVASVAVVAFAIPGVTESLQFDIEKAFCGEAWRIITGHLTHYGRSHLFWDLLMFVVLGAVCERRSGAFYGPALAMMAVVISAAIVICCPQIGVYRGLSGLDTGLFAWFVTDQAVRSVRMREWTPAGIWLAMGGGLLCKLGFEWATGSTLFVDSEGFMPLVQSHIAGLITGVGAFVGAVVIMEGKQAVLWCKRPEDVVMMKNIA